MKRTTIKLDRITRSLIDCYAASAWSLRSKGVLLTNIDGIKEKIDTRNVADDMDRFLVKDMFESIFPGYVLTGYDIDSGVATVEYEPVMHTATTDENATSGGRG